MVSVDNLTISFGGWDLFKEISLLINPKDRIGLVGKNGAGKTTLLKVIMGLQPPTSGVVTRSADTTLGYLPQQMTVADTTTLVDETTKAFEEVLALEAEIARLQGFMTGIQKKLSNERFVQNAPAQVVEMEKKKLADAESKIAALEETVKALRG